MRRRVCKPLLGKVANELDAKSLRSCEKDEDEDEDEKKHKYKEKSEKNEKRREEKKKYSK